MKATEVWKDVDGYAGYYQVSDCGNVKSLDRKESWAGFTRSRKGRVLRGRIDKYGYNTVLLMRDAKPKHFTVHKLVAVSFIGKPDDHQQVNHIDGIKTNNAPSNLEWCSSQDNIQHSWRSGLATKQTGKKHHASVAVIAIKDTAIIEFECLRQCAEYIGVTTASVWAALRRGGMTKGFSIYEA